MIECRQATKADEEFLWELHRAAFMKYVDETWGWDDDRQKAYFESGFDPENLQIVRYRGQDVGVLALETRGGGMHLSRVAILPAYQNKGIGTVVIKQVLDRAVEEGCPVTAQVLKVNPAKSLYEWLGFEVVGETVTHFILAWGEAAETGASAGDCSAG